jgi:hypothetical protein
MLPLVSAEQPVEQAQPKKKWSWRQPRPFRQGAIQIGIAVIAAFVYRFDCYPNIGTWLVSAMLALVMPALLAFLFARSRGDWRGFGNFLLVMLLLWIVASSHVPPK